MEQRAQENGELEYHIKEPPPYDGIYSDQLLDVPKHVRFIYTYIVKFLNFLIFLIGDIRFTGRTLCTT